MSTISDKLGTALQDVSCTVYYFGSTEAPLLGRAAQKARTTLLQNRGESEFTIVRGPVPDMGEIIAAAGTISFFGTKRVVELREIAPSGMTDKDVEELCALFSQLENAVLIITALYKDKRIATSTKAKKLLAAAQKVGFGAELAKPTTRETITFLHAVAKQAGVAFASGAAESLLERAGEDPILLQNETEKLAAMSGYTTIDTALVARNSVYNIEADVFELSRLIMSRNKAAVYQKLQDLFSLKNEPIAISAALAGVFVDMARVRYGTQQGKSVAEIFAEMGYKGNSYRLQKAKENAAPYSTQALASSIMCLSQLDAALKSSALPDKTILVEATVGRLMQLGTKS